MNRNDKPLSAIDTCIILTIIYAALKVAGVIKWSWIWVLSPLWILIVASIAMWTVLAIIIYFTDDGGDVWKRK